MFKETFPLGCFLDCECAFIRVCVCVSLSVCIWICIACVHTRMFVAVSRIAESLTAPFHFVVRPQPYMHKRNAIRKVVWQIVAEAFCGVQHPFGAFCTLGFRLICASGEETWHDSYPSRSAWRPQAGVGPHTLLQRGPWVRSM